MALAKGVGLFGLFVLGGFGIALLVDRRDTFGGGQRIVSQLAPSANIRLLPTATHRRASPAAIDAAIDRLAVELLRGTAPGRATPVLLTSTGPRPPVHLAEQIASSLNFAGIPTLFIVAGANDLEIEGVRDVSSFADLLDAPSVTGPTGLPANAGEPAQSSEPTVAWLKPRGSVESSGLLRQAVRERLVDKVGAEGFESLVFVTAGPVHSAAAAALGLSARPHGRGHQRQRGDRRHRGHGAHPQRGQRGHPRGRLDMSASGGASAAGPAPAAAPERGRWLPTRADWPLWCLTGGMPVTYLAGMQGLAWPLVAVVLSLRLLRARTAVFRGRRCRSSCSSAGRCSASSRSTRPICRSSATAGSRSSARW